MPQGDSFKTHRLTADLEARITILDDDLSKLENPWKNGNHGFRDIRIAPNLEPQETIMLETKYNIDMLLQQFHKQVKYNDLKNSLQTESTKLATLLDGRLVSIIKQVLDDGHPKKEDFAVKEELRDYVRGGDFPQVLEAMNLEQVSDNSTHYGSLVQTVRDLKKDVVDLKKHKKEVLNLEKENAELKNENVCLKMKILDLKKQMAGERSGQLAFHTTSMENKVDLPQRHCPDDTPEHGPSFEADSIRSAFDFRKAAEATEEIQRLDTPVSKDMIGELQKGGDSDGTTRQHLKHIFGGGSSFEAAKRRHFSLGSSDKVVPEGPPKTGSWAKRARTRKVVTDDEDDDEKRLEMVSGPALISDVPFVFQD